MNEVNVYSVLRMPIKEKERLKINIGAEISMLASGKRLVNKALVSVIFEILQLKFKPDNLKELDNAKYYNVRLSDGSEFITDEAGKTALS